MISSTVPLPRMKSTQFICAAARRKRATPIAVKMMFGIHAQNHARPTNDFARRTRQTVSTM